MSNTEDFNFIMQTLNDYLQTLPKSSAVALALHLEHCMNNIKKQLPEITEETH